MAHIDFISPLHKRTQRDYLGRVNEFPNEVQRILFDPNGLYAGEGKFIRTKSWEQTHKLLL